MNYLLFTKKNYIFAIPTHDNTNELTNKRKTRCNV